MAESFGVLNTNLAAQQAYFYLQNNTTKLNEASDKVASGLRVRGSQDDPAGYIQITRFKSVIAGLTTAKQNVGSAKSLTGIVDGGLSSIRDLLQEARATALVASDATKSASERNALDATIRQNIQEIDDLVRQTTFGGKALLDGTANFTFQTGANAGDVTQLKIEDSFYAKDLKVGDPGSAATVNWATTPSVSTSASVANATWTIEFQSSGTFTVTNTAVGSSPTATGTVGTEYASQGITFQIDAPTGTSYAKGDRITFTTEENEIKSVEAGTAQGTKGSMSTTAASNYTDTVDGTFTVTVTGDGDATDDGGAGTQLTADYSFIGTDGSTSTGTITLDSDTGIGQIGTTGVYVDFSDYDAINTTDDFKTGDTFTFDVTASEVFAPDETGVIGSDGVTLKSANASATSIVHIDAAIEKIEAAITKIGSTQRRLDIKLLSLDTQIRNNDSARSVIEDADVAQEQLNVAKFQILQQTSLASVVAANTQPQSILGLFR